MASPKTNQPVVDGVSVVYNILWMCTAAGKQGLSTGRIEITSVPGVLDGHDFISLPMPNKYSADDSQEDLLLADTSKSSVETSDKSEATKSDCEAETALKSLKTSQHSFPGIPCIAKLSLSPWEASFYCMYDQVNDSFRTQDQSVLAFGIRNMNEWMEMALMGNSTTVPRLTCEGIDDHGHDLLKVIIFWNWGGSTVSRLYAKRATGNDDWELSEAERQKLGILDVVHDLEEMNTYDSSPQPSLNTLDDSPLPSPMHDHQDNLEREEPSGGNGRGSFRGRASSRRGDSSRGRNSSRARGTSQARGGFRGRGDSGGGRAFRNSGRQRSKGSRGGNMSQPGPRIEPNNQRGPAPVKAETAEAGEARAQLGWEDPTTEDLINL